MRVCVTVQVSVASSFFVCFLWQDYRTSGVTTWHHANGPPPKPAPVDSSHEVGGRVAGLPRVSYNEAVDAQRCPRRYSIPATSSAPTMSPVANDKSAGGKVMRSATFTVNYL